MGAVSLVQYTQSDNERGLVAAGFVNERKKLQVSKISTDASALVKKLRTLVCTFLQVATGHSKNAGGAKVKGDC